VSRVPSGTRTRPGTAGRKVAMVPCDNCIIIRPEGPQQECDLPNAEKTLEQMIFTTIEQTFILSYVLSIRVTKLGKPVELPRIGAKTRVISAIPRKRSLANRSAQYTLDLAIFELIDNSLDNWRLNRLQTDLDITVRFTFSEGVLSRMNYRDNAGGAPDDRLEALVRLGEENPSREGIGVWGEGLKVACHALGRKIDIFTRHGAGKGYCLRLEDGWLDKDSWDVPCFEAEGVEPGTTLIDIEGVKQQAAWEEIAGSQALSLRNRLGMTYSSVLSSSDGPRAHIHLQADEGAISVEPHWIGTGEGIRRYFAFPPGFEPTEHLKSFEINGRKLRSKIIVGLSPEQSRDLSGVSMWGNGRLFDLAKKEYSVGFGTRGRARLPASHPTMWRLQVWVFFEGDPTLIPWSAPAKNGYNENHQLADEIRSFILDVATPYSIYTRVAKRIDLLPHSVAWNELSPEKRIAELDRYFGDLPDSGRRVGEAFKKAPHLTSDFAPPTRLTSWDRDRDIDPPALAPCFSVAKAKQVANLIAERDDDPDRPWIEKQKLLDRLARGLEVSPLTKQLAESSHPRLGSEDELVAVTVRLPRRAVNTLENARGKSASAILSELALEEASRTNPILRIPQAEFRAVVDLTVTKLRQGIPDLRGIALFGSVARGDADRASDIDLLLIHDNPSGAERQALEIVKPFAHDLLVERYKIRPIAESPETLRKQPRGKAGPGSIVREGILLLSDDAVLRLWANLKGGSAWRRRGSSVIR